MRIKCFLFLLLLLGGGHVFGSEDLLSDMESAIKQNNIKKFIELYERETKSFKLSGDVESYLLYSALIKNNTEIIKYIIENEAEVKGDNDYLLWQYNTPLYIATSKKNDEIIKLLMEKGASPLDIPPGEFDRPNFLFYKSISENNTLYTEICINYGFNVNYFDITVSFETPLNVAILSNNIQAFKLLIENGAKINTVNLLNDYMSPLSLSIKKHGKSSEFVKILENKNAYDIEYKFSKPFIGYCSTKNLRIRTFPNTDSAIIGLLQENDEVKMLGVTPISYEIDDMYFPWINIEKDNIEGWVYGGYIKKEKIESQSFNY